MKDTLLLILFMTIIGTNCNNLSTTKGQSIELKDSVVYVENSESQDSIKSLSSIIFYVDSVYNIRGSMASDTVINWSVTQNDKYDLGPRGLDLEHLVDYFQYRSFDFLIFEDKVTANDQFNRIIEVCLLERPKRSEFFWKIFTKAGSTYIIYNDMIIYHQRRCNFVDEIENAREDNLLNFLYSTEFQPDTSLVRVKCGWTKQELR